MRGALNELQSSPCTLRFVSKVVKPNTISCFSREGTSLLSALKQATTSGSFRAESRLERPRPPAFDRKNWRLAHGQPGQKQRGGRCCRLHRQGQQSRLSTAKSAQVRRLSP